MIHSRGARGSDFELVITQILQGLGGGFAAVASQVGAQASVPHVDVAIVTAVVLLWTEIGGAVGGAIGECQFFSLERKKKSIHNRILREIVIAGAIWSNEMPKALAKYLPDLTQDQRDALFGSITDVRSLPLSDPTRQGVISGTYSYSPYFKFNPELQTENSLTTTTAYDSTMKTMIIAATALSVVPILISLFMPNWYLGDRQNAVDAADLTGERGAPVPSSSSSGPATDGEGEEGGA